MKSEYEFRTINTDDIPEMADLLLGRQNIEGQVFPFLKNSCLNVQYIMERLQELFADNRVIGIGALVNDELVGYAIEAIETEHSHERYVSVPYEGAAVRKDQSSELVRCLYKKVSVLWLEQGCFKHSIRVPIGDKLYYEGFLKLSFAIEQVYAVMNIREYKPFETLADVRLADKMDSDAFGRMSNIITKYHNSAPVFILAFPEVFERRKEAFKGMVEENEDIVLIAEKNQKELGYHDYEIIPPNLMTLDNAVELCVAGTYDSQMGRGIGKKLMNEGCRIIKEKGYGYITSDWRITNLAASTF